jgi:hypothetical protein
VTRVTAKFYASDSFEKTLGIAVRERGGCQTSGVAVLTGSPLMNQLSMADGFDLAELQLNLTMSPT